MKKKLLFAAMLLGAVTFANAQTNIQEMWDYNRGHLTTTLEMLQADNWGSSFFFVDIYHKTAYSTPTDFYAEISRSLNFWQQSALAPLSLHVEWNGGCGIFDLGGYNNWDGYQVRNAWLLGVEYMLHNEDYTNTFIFQLMYKHIGGQRELSGYYYRPFDKVSDIPIQFTFVWGMKNLFGAKGLTFSGYLDVWGENVNWGYDNSLNPINTKFVLISEPQIWYNVGQHFGCPNLNVGGEVEVAYNFTGGCKVGYDNKGLTVAPCLGVKWVF